MMKTNSSNAVELFLCSFQVGARRVPCRHLLWQVAACQHMNVKKRNISFFIRYKLRMYIHKCDWERNLHIHANCFDSSKEKVLKDSMADLWNARNIFTIFPNYLTFNRWGNIAIVTTEENLATDEKIRE